MRKTTRLLISTSALVIMIEAAFFAGKLELSSAQDGGFKMYQLLVFCGNSGLASAIFGHTVTEGGTVGRPLMGTKSICVGNCGGGGTVSLEDALAGLPAEVSAALKAKVDKHQEDAAAGKGSRLTCLQDGKEKPKDKEDCEKPTPWFGPPPSGCKDVRSPNVRIHEAYLGIEVALEVCAYTFYYKPVKDLKDPLERDLIEDQLIRELKKRFGSKVCCDKFQEARRTGKPCDPTWDLDCDGKLNDKDIDTGGLPDINRIFSTARGAPVDPFPPGLDPDDTEFFPPQDKCDCKWELMKGTLTCSPDGKQPHSYQARWKCPSTGNERFTRKEARPTAPCK
jgi:hypothetical protein